MPAKRIEDGLPVNMELCALSGEDKRLIAVAKRIEKILGV
jgi:Asp-tRNA(Asn)/Glu-tRNA(Gln) amidotransferase A subunit family amidase